MIEPKKPHERLVCVWDGFASFRATNELLKSHGLVLKWRDAYGGDQVFVRVEKLGEVQPEPQSNDEQAQETPP
jgi:hypothetical protein